MKGFFDMLKIKLMTSCFFILSALTLSGESATVPAASPAIATVPAASASLNVQNCTAQNGKLGDSNPQLRDFCLSQSNDINTGKAHYALPYAMEYYNTIGCTPALAVSVGNCQNAANIIAHGTLMSFHLDFTTLAKIRNASPSGSTGCSCPA
jgi:hypothetical protein